MMERTLNYGEREYKNLVAAAMIMEAFSKHDARYTVQTTYLDFGQDWKWTTICRKDYMECQVLCPRDWKKITSATTVQELCEAVQETMLDKYYSD